MVFTWNILWHSVIVVSYLCMFFLFYAYRKNENLKINLRLNVQDALFTLRMFLITMALLGIAVYFRILEPNPAIMDILHLATTIMYLLILIAPVEELLFRGVITHWLVKKTNVFFGVIISAVIFGLSHLPNGATGISPDYWNWHLMMISGISGVLFGVTYLKTKSIIHPILLHAASSIAWFLFVL